MFEITVTVKDHRGMVTSGHERPCFLFCKCDYTTEGQELWSLNMKGDL